MIKWALASVYLPKSLHERLQMHILHCTVDNSPLSVASTPLSKAEEERLHQLEHIVTTGLANFLEVGRSLLEIREHKLYRTYGTFEDYCRERFGISQHRGLELARATRVAEHLLEGPAGPEGDSPLPGDLAEQTLRPFGIRLEPMYCLMM
jgi:hypothetical protein